MRSHSNKACWKQPRNERVELFSSSRQTTPVQNPIQQTQTQNYGEQGNQQNPALINLHGNSKQTVKKQIGTD